MDRGKARQWGNTLIKKRDWNNEKKVKRKKNKSTETRRQIVFEAELGGLKKEGKENRLLLARKSGPWESRHVGHGGWTLSSYWIKKEKEKRDI